MSQYKDYNYSDNQATHAHRYLTNPILNILEEINPKLILDLGCGNGALVKHLIELGYNAYGTDASEKGIAIARQSYPDRFSLQNLDEDGLPESFSHLKFDTIISTEVIEHLYDPRSFIDFCIQVLKKNQEGGKLILSTPYHGYLKNLALAIADKWDSHANPLWDGGHIKLWSRKTLSLLLEEKGFKIMAFKGCGRFPYFWKSMIIVAEV